MAAAAAACRRAVSHTLHGPPMETLRVAATAAAPTVTGDPFVDLLDSNFNKPIHQRSMIPQPAKIRTENYSPTFPSSADPCLDFFFHVVPGTPADSVSSMLAAAWAKEPATALRLACNLRGVRGTGKSDQEGFYAAALWMHRAHPATLALNARSVAEFGYLKDLPEILHRIVHGGASTKTREKKDKGDIVRRQRYKRIVRFRSRMCGCGCRRNIHGHGRRPRRDANTRATRVAASMELDRKVSAVAAAERGKKRAESWARAVETYTRDPNYRLLHDSTADLFADLLAEDLQKLSTGDVGKLSLAAKWCPSLDTCYDKSTLLCEAIACRLFPKGSAAELPLDLPDAYHAYRARERLRKDALKPLRCALQLPEVFMSAGAWAQLVYTRVASVAMKNYRDVFLRRDAERFNLYLADVKSGDAKIAAGALLPHEIVESARFGGAVADLQWQRMVADLQALGMLRNCLAVCDVSGSMEGEPMEVCIALGLLLSELCDEPWRHRVVTFSERPRLHRVVGDKLWEKAHFVRRMEWGFNTNFQAVFDQLLAVAVAGGLPPERMVRKVFVFSDMEFDQASQVPWETDYEAITRKYAEAGYGEAVPEIVFWNLHYSRSVPVTAEQKGVALVSGFSKNMVKLFLDGKDIASPRAVMEKAISGPEYGKLVVLD